MESTRLAVPTLDEILGEPFSVLDQGFVRVVDYMGADESVVQAARVSYGRGTKRLQEDRGLIRYLMRHRHTTPFEMCELKLHVRVPMDCWRQWIRHRTANINEYSTRYSEAIDAAQETPPDGWRQQSTSNKQGSDEPVGVSLGATLSREEAQLQQRAREIYYGRLAAGIAREQARKDLPLSTYTEAYWKIDLHNLLHFLDLRMEAHAQQEIRAYATTIGEQIVAKWVPVAPAEVPAETGLQQIRWARPAESAPESYTTPDDPSSCWKNWAQSSPAPILPAAISPPITPQIISPSRQDCPATKRRWSV